MPDFFTLLCLLREWFAKACGTVAVIEGNVCGVPQYLQDKVNILLTAIFERKFAKVDFAWYPSWLGRSLHFHLVHKRLIVL